MTTTRSTSILAILAILFLALNLRGPFTSVAPVLEQIMHSLGLASSAAGFLTALPLLTFAFFSPLVTKVSCRIGVESSLILALVFIAIGIFVRSWGAMTTLYLGTILIGAGIALGNVLLPVVVKVNFPTRIAAVTSLYIFTMGIGSTLSSSLMVPLSNIELYNLTGWQLALLFNLFFPIVALVIWLPKRGKRTANSENKNDRDKSSSIRNLLRSPVAWQVTFALGLNSFTFYSLAGWLPKILSDIGYSEVDAGYIYGFLQFSTMVPGLLLLPILAKKYNQQLLIVLCAFSVFIGVIGLLLFPDWAIFWVGLFGLANCSTFIVALSFIGLRTSNAVQAASLSGMSQSIGYALAATGPTIMGQIYTQNESWTAPLLLIAGVALVCTFFAALAAKDKKVFD